MNNAVATPSAPKSKLPKPCANLSVRTGLKAGLSWAWASD